MSIATRSFFAELNSDSTRQVPPGSNGTLRFDVRDGDRTERWLLRFRDGQVRADLSDSAADCVVTIDRELFERILGGEDGLEPAFVRHAFTVEGLLPLLLSFRWLLPDMTGARRPAQLAAGWARSR